MRTGLAPVLTLAAALSLIAAAPGQADTTWVNVPGTSGTWVRSIEAGTPPTTVYAGTEGSGVYKSDNGGASFSAFNGGLSGGALNVRAIVAGSTAYAGTQNGLFSSSGGSWAPVAQGDETNPPTKLNRSVQAFLTNPTTPGQMLAGTFGGGVFRSSDSGSTWTPPAAGNGMPSGETVWGLTAHPVTAGLVFAATSSGIYRSTDFGSSWTYASDGIPFTVTLRVWVDVTNVNIYYAGTTSGVYRSINAGLTWSAINTGLGSNTVRGLQAFEGTDDTNLYAATDNGVWHTRTPNGPTAGPAKWRAVTGNGLGSNTALWAIENYFPNPLIYVGTQSNGAYAMTMTPPSNAGGAALPMLNDTTPTAGQQLTATNGTWNGTQTIDYTYQWQRCTTALEDSCTDIPNATESSYTVNKAADVDPGARRLRIVVSATNPFPTFTPVKEESAITAVVANSANTLPGYTQQYGVSTEIVDPGDDDGQANVGDTLHTKNGTGPSMPTSDGWFNPPASSYAYQWQRCTAANAGCVDIPGGIMRDYPLVAADGGYRMRVELTGTNGTGSTIQYSGTTFPVIAAPATAITGPSLAGTAKVGETMIGSVGEWKAADTFFERRWEQCNADGSSCTTINKVASTDPETGPGYLVRAGDVGKTIKMKVKADVGNDPAHNQLPAAVEVYSPLSEVIVSNVVPGPDPGPDPTPDPTPDPVVDKTAPVISKLSMTNKKFRVGPGATAITAKKSPVGTAFKLTMSELATLKVTLQRVLPGRRVKGKCVAPQRKFRKKPRCTRTQGKGVLTRAGLTGAAKIPFSGRVGKKKLARGSYKALFTATDAFGNKSKTASLKFKIVRR